MDLFIRGGAGKQLDSWVWTQVSTLLQCSLFGTELLGFSRPQWDWTEGIVPSANKHKIQNGPGPAGEWGGRGGRTKSWNSLGPSVTTLVVQVKGNTHVMLMLGDTMAGCKHSRLSKDLLPFQVDIQTQEMFLKTSLIVTCQGSLTGLS